jgi:hypothetical protein
VDVLADQIPVVMFLTRDVQRQQPPAVSCKSAAADTASAKHAVLQPSQHTQHTLTGSSAASRLPSCLSWTAGGQPLSDSPSPWQADASTPGGVGGGSCRIVPALLIKSTGRGLLLLIDCHNRHSMPVTRNQPIQHMLSVILCDMFSQSTPCCMS